jgi:SRSO17 transposase
MKHHQHITLVEANTTPTQVVQWAQALIHLHARIAARFARPEPRHRALEYLQGILSSIERKNGWQLAEHAREARPDGMQRLLGRSVWDTDGVRDDLRSYVLEQLGQESAILVIDETSFPKQGQKSAGVGVQYCGTTGQVEHCQVGVFLSYGTAKGHTPISRELYLPLDWTEDRDRCQAAGIPESVRFQTKPELARRMLARLWDAQVPLAWVVADTVYGGNLDLRNWLEAHQYPYVLAVPCNEPVGILTRDGQRKRVEVWEVEALLLGAQDWQRLSMSEGTKGPRLFDWASVPILQKSAGRWTALFAHPP